MASEHATSQATGQFPLGVPLVKKAVIDRVSSDWSGWDALIASVDPAWSTEAHAIGEWSFKDVVAHLTGWRQPLIDELSASVQGTPLPPSDWPYTYEETEEPTPDGDARTQIVNDWLHLRNHHRSYPQVLAQATVQWTLLQTSVKLMPDALLRDPACFPRLGGSSLAQAMLGGDTFSHFHDEHEPQIRA